MIAFLAFALTASLSSADSRTAPPCGGNATRVVPLSHSGRETLFCRLTHGGLLLSRCVSPKGTPEPQCQATAALRSASKFEVAPLGNGRNPAAVLCKALKGTIFIGTYPNGSEQCLCGFKDQSLLSCSALISDALPRP